MRTGAAALAALLMVPAVVGAAPRQAPEDRCVLADRRLTETSGLVVGPGGPRVVDDSGTPSTVYRLDARCTVAGSRAVPVAGRDVEDLASAADGTLWLADTGDNARSRRAVAIIRLPPRGGEIVTPLTYPDGPHDAETLVLPPDDRPVIVTKDLGGRSGIYTTDAPLPASVGPAPIELRRVGEVTVPSSDTVGGPVGPFGATLFTGGALAPDGRVVALRTYTDAWLYPVTGEASAEAVTAALRTAPVRIPLPDEPQGEAVAVDASGTLFSAGESPAGGPRATLRAVVGAEQRAGRADASPAAAPAPVDTTAPSPPETSPAARVGIAAASVVLALLLVLVLGRIVRRRAAARGRP